MINSHYYVLGIPVFFEIDMLKVVALPINPFLQLVAAALTHWVVMHWVALRRR